ncbi:MAG: hypothetical protein HYZ10_09170, partial [Ignavibacteriales bacterium]|nr:hypothetical protein [Ignavibacteriales bacterium]
MISSFKNISWMRLTFTFLGGIVLLFILAPIAGRYFNTAFGSITNAVGDEEVRDSVWL